MYLLLTPYKKELTVMIYLSTSMCVISLFLGLLAGHYLARNRARRQRELDVNSLLIAARTKVIIIDVSVYPGTTFIVASALDKGTEKLTFHSPKHAFDYARAQCAYNGLPAFVYLTKVTTRS